MGRRIEDYYNASLNVRNMLSLFSTVHKRLEINPARLELFRNTCFGPWLELRDEREALLIHVFLQSQHLPEDTDRDALYFDIGPHRCRFSREDFCLITGLRFGSERLSVRPTLETFHATHFPTSMKKILISDLMSLLKNDSRFAAMSDLDAVRLCLLLLAECAFCGREVQAHANEEFLNLIDDLNAWNDFPWGSFLWDQSSRAIRHANVNENKRRQNILKGQKARYSICGFLLPLKIWIYETFPYILATDYARKIPTIPRALGWTRNHKTPQLANLIDIIRTSHEATNTPLNGLEPTLDERNSRWFVDSWKFFGDENKTVATNTTIPGYAHDDLKHPIPLKTSFDVDPTNQSTHPCDINIQPNSLEDFIEENGNEEKEDNEEKEKHEDPKSDYVLKSDYIKLKSEFTNLKNLYNDLLKRVESLERDRVPSDKKDISKKIPEESFENVNIVTKTDKLKEAVDHPPNNVVSDINNEVFVPDFESQSVNKKGIFWNSRSKAYVEELFRTPSASGSVDRAVIQDMQAKIIQPTKQVKRKNAPVSQKQVHRKKRVYKTNTKQGSTFDSLQTLPGMDLRKQSIKKSLSALRLRAPNLVDLADFVEADNEQFFFLYIDKVEIVVDFWDLLLHLDPDRKYAGWLIDDKGRKQLHCANGSGRIKYFPRWTYNTISLVYLPVVVGKEHWVLLSIDLHSWSVTIYNSMYPCYHTNAVAVVVELEKCFRELLQNVNYYDNVDKLPDMKSFSVIIPPDVPKQKNGRDCGVFVCMFLECLTQGKPVTTKTITMTGCQFREYMAYQFWSGRVAAPPTDYVGPDDSYPGGYPLIDDIDLNMM